MVSILVFVELALEDEYMGENLMYRVSILVFVELALEGLPF